MYSTPICFLASSVVQTRRAGTKQPDVHDAMQLYCTEIGLLVLSEYKLMLGRYY